MNKPNQISFVKDFINTEHVLQAIEKDREKYRRTIKSRDYMIISDRGEVFDSKDVFARAANIATKSNYTYHDFRGGKNPKYKNRPDKSDRVGDVLEYLLRGTIYRVTDPLDKEKFTADYIKKSISETYIKSIEANVSNNIEGYDYKVITKARINQGEFRDRLIARYGKCCLCGMDITELLIASHIKPWRKSSGEEKLDENNGLLLCPNHDKLFDGFLITFENNGKIVISDKINCKNKALININDNSRIEITKKMIPYIEYHRKEFYESRMK